MLPAISEDGEKKEEDWALLWDPGYSIPEDGSFAVEIPQILVLFHVSSYRPQLVFLLDIIVQFLGEFKYN